MTPREYARQNRHIGEAWEDGKTVQYRRRDLNQSWFDWTSDERPTFTHPRCEWRIKPEPPAPKFRPWKPEEVPANALYRRRAWLVSDPGSWSVILAVSLGRIAYISATLSMDSLQDAFHQGEHSTDGGKTWRPCGVEVKE